MVAPKFKPGDQVTVVYRSNLPGRHVSLVNVEKVGRKWLHGMTLFVNHAGDLREGHKVKHNMETCSIYPGHRLDIRETEREYLQKYHDWKLSRKTYENDIERELRKEVWAQVDEWDKENPMPQLQDLPEA